MNISRRNVLLGAAALPSLRAVAANGDAFRVAGDHFELNGKPFQILSGEMHYERVPREYWRDRMRKMRAMGLNTLCTYAFWNTHEPEPEQFDFSGNLDIAAYIRTAAEEGLHVILRPGPYACAEWDFGGFPYWLLREGVKVRSTDPQFLGYAARYLEKLGQQTARLQITHGGPILMVQLENEYGSFGIEKRYLNAIRQMLLDAGYDVTLYTADGSELQQLAGGTLPDVMAAINFGAGDAAPEFANLEKFRQGTPKMCGEYWDGWFDHWAETHHTVSVERVLTGYEWMLARGISVNLYMAHGGTSFGFMAGANYGPGYQPDISSYDYDSPIDEAGRPTDKFFALQKAIRKSAGENASFPELPAPTKMIKIDEFELKECAPLSNLLKNPQQSEEPKTMEEMKQAYGYILYRTTVAATDKALLGIDGLRDFAVLHQGERLLGTLDRRLNQSKLTVSLKGDTPLDILVENMGRINFGPRLVDDRKGITGKVTLDGRELRNWQIYSLPMTDLDPLQYTSEIVNGPAFYRGAMQVNEPGDTFLDLRGFNKGSLWVNRRNLGRYWSMGPQRSVYVPGCWLKAGINEVVALDVLSGGSRILRGGHEPIYDLARESNGNY